MNKHKGPTILFIRYCIGCFEILEEREVQSSQDYEHRFPDETATVPEPGPCCFGE